MAAKLSTGLRNKMLDTNPLKTIMAAGFIKIYGGTVPATADDGLGGATLLCTVSISSGGTGINFAASAAAGVIQKSGSEVWSGVNVASGTATFFRHVLAADTGTLSTTESRIQGTVATAGADLNLSSVSLTISATQTIDYYSVAIPTL
jgi:hypothetical protein